MSESHNVSRGIGVVLTSTVLLRPELLTALSVTLRQTPCPYSIYVTDEPSTFELFIESDRILIHSEPSLLHQLGLTAST